MLILDGLNLMNSSIFYWILLGFLCLCIFHAIYWLQPSLLNNVAKQCAIWQLIFAVPLAIYVLLNIGPNVIVGNLPHWFAIDC